MARELCFVFCLILGNSICIFMCWTKHFKKRERPRSKLGSNSWHSPRDKIEFLYRLKYIHLHAKKSMRQKTAHWFFIQCNPPKLPVLSNLKRCRVAVSCAYLLGSGNRYQKEPNVLGGPHAHMTLKTSTDSARNAYWMFF